MISVNMHYQSGFTWTLYITEITGKLGASNMFTLNVAL